MRILYIILIAIAGLITLIAIMFYFYLRVKSIDVSNESPFSEVIDKKLILERDVFLIRNNTPGFYKSISTVVDEEGLIGPIDKETKMVDIIKKGTPFTIQKAEIRSHGESGTYGLITGILHTEKYNIPFKQRWGRFSVYILDGAKQIDNKIAFTFQRAIWESETEYILSKTYFLPEL